MKKLQEELTITKFKYSTVEVDILPDTISPAELDMFESSLQRKISLPLEFSWIDTASQADKYRKDKKTDKDIIDLLNLKKSSHSVDNEIKKFIKASEFLTWISKEEKKLMKMVGHGLKTKILSKYLKLHVVMEEKKERCSLKGRI